MTKTTCRLTAVGVRGITNQGMHADGDGLYLKVAPGGSKSWVLRYMLDGRARYYGLGSVAAVGLGKAREGAGAARALVAQGIDPIDYRNERAKQAKLNGARGMTFREAAKAYIAAHEPSWRNPKHRQQWRNTLATYAYHVLGDVPVGDIDTGLICAVLEPIWTTKPDTASRLRGRIEQIIDWAKVRGAPVGENPARWRGHLDKLLPTKTKVRAVRHHPAMPWQQVPAYMAKLRRDKCISAKALEFGILTWARTSEIILATRSEIDFDAKVWTIPAERMKGRREHRVPLSDRAIDLLKSLPTEKGNEFLFIGAHEGEPLSNMAMLEYLQGRHPDLTVHGFRSSARDWAGESTSFPHDICEAALAHKRRDKTHAAYQRGELLMKRRKLMTAWERYCSGEPSANDAAAE